MAVDNKYEFNCPQYFDFNSCVQNDSLDSYFDFDHENELNKPLFNAENIEKTSSLPEGSHFKKDTKWSQKAAFSEKSYSKARNKQKMGYNTGKQTSKQDSGSYSKLCNPRLQKENFMSEMPESKRQKLSQTLQKCMYNLRSLSPSCKTPLQNKNSSARKSALKDITPNTTNGAVSRSASLQHSEKQKSLSRQSPRIRRRSVTVSGVSEPSPKVKKLTLPSTPNCIKRVLTKFTNNAKKVKSSEDMELDKIAQFRKKLAANRKLNEKTLKKAMAPPPSHSVSLSSHHTVVKPFNFATDQRIKDQTPKQGEKVKDFISSLRQHSTNSEKTQTKVTKMVPFNFTENRKRKRTGEIRETYQSLAQQVMAFQKKTPVRFHSGSKGTLDHSSDQILSAKITCPRTPKLQTLTRHRPVTAISHEQQEEMEVEEMKKYKFKANPVNPRLFTETSGLPKVDSRPLTKAVDFPLETRKRYYLREKEPASEPKFEFHAQPVPEKILKGTVGVKEKTPKPSTQPKSPAFAVKEREAAWKERISKKVSKEEEEEDVHVPILKAKPAPHSDCPFSAKWKKKSTIIQPFSFDSKDQVRWTKKEERIKQELENEKKLHEFYAHPMPDPSPRGIPQKQKKPSTKPQPFNLLIDQRGEERAAKWQKDMEEELEKQKELLSFKAQPASVVYKPPFVPEKSQKPLTEIVEIPLNTDHRASEREKFEQYKKELEAKLEAEHQRQKEIEEEEEREALLRQRAETVHKANPVRHFKPVEIKPSNKELTHPRLPEFATTLRLRQRLGDSRCSESS